MRELDDRYYDASEEESVCEMERETKGVVVEKAIAILDAMETQLRSVSEPVPVRKWAGKHTLRPRPALTGDSTSDEENFSANGSKTRQKARKTKIARRSASWPQPPLRPKSHDSGVHGLDSSDDDTDHSGNEDRLRGTRHQRKLTVADVLNLAHVENEGDEDVVAFKGIAAVDSIEEQWRQIVLEEHMDRIFNAMPKPPSGEEDFNEKYASILDEPTRRASFETTDEWGIPTRKKMGWKQRLRTIVRLFCCVGPRG